MLYPEKYTPFQTVDLDEVNRAFRKMELEAEVEVAIDLRLTDMYGHKSVYLTTVMEQLFKERCRSVASEGAQEVTWF